jgi:hypothetical protein
MEPDDPEQVAELEAMLADLTARIEAATLELRKQVFWVRMEQLERAEIQMLERWYRA